MSAKAEPWNVLKEGKEVDITSGQEHQQLTYHICSTKWKVVPRASIILLSGASWQLLVALHSTKSEESLLNVENTHVWLLPCGCDEALMKMVNLKISFLFSRCFAGVCETWSHLTGIWWPLPWWSWSMVALCTSPSRLRMPQRIPTFQILSSLLM